MNERSVTGTRFEWLLTDGELMKLGKRQFVGTMDGRNIDCFVVVVAVVVSIRYGRHRRR